MCTGRVCGGCGGVGLLVVLCSRASSRAPVGAGVRVWWLWWSRLHDALRSRAGVQARGLQSYVCDTWSFSCTTVVEAAGHCAEQPAAADT